MAVWYRAQPFRGARPILSLAIQSSPILSVCLTPQFVSVSGLASLVLLYALAMIPPLAVGVALRLEYWWLGLNAALSALGLVVIWISLPPVTALAALTVTGLLLGPAVSDRVPLFLSTTSTAKAVDRIVYRLRANSFADLGAGLGGVSLKVARGGRRVWAIERSPLVWLVLRLRAIGAGGDLSVVRGNLFAFPLAEIDVAYAYLSPAAMPDLLAKAKAEMREGAWLISNSFCDEATPPIRCITLRDARRTHLYLWQMPGQMRRTVCPSAASDQND